MPLSFRIFKFFNKISNYFYQKYLDGIVRKRKTYDKMGKSFDRVG